MGKTISILFSNKYKNCNKKIENDLLWYDSVLMKMKRFKGGSLEFKYEEDPELIEAGYRMIPKVSDKYRYEKELVSNEKEVLKWFDNFQNYRDSNSIIISKNELEIEFDVPENEVEEFIYDCERNGFEYDKK